MTIINKSHQFVFVHIPKAAGSSIAKYYRQLSRVNDIEIGASISGTTTVPDAIWKHEIGKHAPYHRIKRFLADDPLKKDYFSFCFARNPYDRVISTFFFLKKWLPNNTEVQARDIFEGFNDVNDMVSSDFWRNSDIDNMFKPQCFWVTDEGGKVIIDFHGKVESLKDGIHYVNRQIGVDLPDFDIRINVKKRQIFTPGLNKESINIIQQRYQQDFDLFEYSAKPPRSLSALLRWR